MDGGRGAGRPRRVGEERPEPSGVRPEPWLRAAAAALVEEEASVRRAGAGKAPDGLSHPGAAGGAWGGPETRRAGHGAPPEWAHDQGRARLRRERVRPGRRLIGARLMLGLPASVRIYFAADLVDMRKGIDGLRALVEGALKKDPYVGHLFVFVGKSRDKVKILFWDRNGFVLYLKRLERGRFQLPVIGAHAQHGSRGA